MKLLKCENGHFYDADKHNSCPKCSGGDGFSETISLINDGGDTLGGFGANLGGEDFYASNFGGVGATVGIDAIPGFGGVGATVAAEDIPSFGGLGATVAATDIPGDVDDVTIPLVPGKSFGATLIPGDDEKTQGVWGGIDISGLTGKNDLSMAGNNTPGGVVIHGTFGGSSFTPVKQSNVFNPSVGWLVCIEGPHLGTDFHLVAGKNKVGRDSSANSVVLSLDTQVSRAPQVEVVYDQLNNLFYAVSGSANSLCYINNQPLLSVVALKKNDVLVVGKSKLMLIPCCDGAFNWNDILKDKEQDK